jgi:hypothetical protein
MSATWQVHVYGLASAALSAWCADQDVPLRVFDWQPKHDAAGLAREALYLLRPDTKAALADPSGVPGVIDRYCMERGIRLGIPSPH